MFDCLVSDPGNDDAAVRDLRARLDQFYATTDTYLVFQAPPDNAAYYRAMEPYVRSLIAERGRARVLELGAGLATFPTHFADIRDKIEYHAQDITPQNRAHLDPISDRVFVGDVSRIDTGPYDLIFSTYVFEHVATPRPFLEQVHRLLRPGGVHVVICPRYDAPGYICPSLRHHGLFGRLAFSTYLTASRVLAAVTRRSRFWVNTDPSMFHGPWYRDADAVHVVSGGDVKRWHRQNGYRVQRLRLPTSGLKQWLLRRVLTLSLACTRGPDR